MKNKNPNQKYLHELPSFTLFKLKGKTYRTIVPLKHTVVNSCHANCTRQVMNMQTNLAEHLNYFTVVTIISEKIENTEK